MLAHTNIIPAVSELINAGSWEGLVYFQSFQK